MRVLNDNTDGVPLVIIPFRIYEIDGEMCHQTVKLAAATQSRVVLGTMVSLEKLIFLSDELDWNWDGLGLRLLL